MAAGPVLHIFPPVEEVNKRRESLDDLIRRSMDMRPTGPWPARGDGYSPITRPKNGGLLPSDATGVGIALTRERSPSPANERVRILPSIEESKFSPRENPFQNLPPIQVPRRSPSAQRGARPRRSSSANGRSRNASGYSPAQRRAPSPSPFPSRKYAVMSVFSDNTPTSAVSPVYPERVYPECDIPSRSSNRSRVCVPGRSEAGEVASITSPVHYALERRGSSKMSNHSNHLIQRHISSRASNQPRYPELQKHSQSPLLQTPVSDFAGHSPSTTLVRNGSIMSEKQWTPVSPQQETLMRSMFPVFNAQVPHQLQSYQPHHVQPIQIISPDQVSRPQYSPSFDNAYKKFETPYITPASDLNSLWATANGQLTTPDPKNFTLKMFRQEATKGKKEKICFGPAEDQPFYSLSKTHTTTEEGDEHELFIQRHHTDSEDILPVSHLDLHPPPAPTLSKSHRGSVISDVHTPAQHVTTITPILATLHALDSAAKTPQAHTIALVDPNATSPAAARLAERAVNEATQRESCTLAWTATDPRNGKYELHHPSLGVFTVATTGDIKSAVERRVVKGETSIAIINPFASLSPINGSPISAGSGGSGGSTAIDREPEIIARLDFQQEALHIDAASIQQLGNLYLIDVCVSALLSVAIAEAKRAEDPGLVFAAPPPSLLSVRAPVNKKLRNLKVKEIKPPKPLKKTRKPRPVTLLANSLGLGFEHLADEDDLPKITKAILGLLGFSFKSAVYLLGMGVRVTAAMVIGITRMATKD